MKWLTFFLSAVCHYILTLLEDDGCAAGSGEATSSVLSWLPLGSGDFLEGERMCLPGGQLALSRKTIVMRRWLGRKTQPAWLDQQGRMRKEGREQPGSPQSLTKRRLFMLKLCNLAAETFWPESKSEGKAACHKAMEYTGGCSSLGRSLFFPLS